MVADAEGASVTTPAAPPVSIEACYLTGVIHMEYEWDPEKEEGNIEKHGISFDTAIRVFDDAFRIEIYDEKHSGLNKYGVWEDR